MNVRGTTRIPVTLCLTLGLLAGTAAGQVTHGGSPLSSRMALREDCGTCEMPAVDVASLRAEDALRGPDEPFRWGQPLALELSPANAGTWERLETGGRVWRLRLHSPGALSIMITFGRFQLPPGADLFVYNDDRSVVRGAYTYLNNRLDGLFAIQPTPGDAVTLEYFEPAGEIGKGELLIDGIVHDYVGIEPRAGGPGSSASCEVDAVCQLGINDQIDSVVQIMTPLGACCSGVLLNNTANDGTQYLLSARHCGNLNNAIFRFNYHRTTCGSGTVPTNDTVTGSLRLLEEDPGPPGKDFQLVLLTTPIPSSYAIKYVGWDRSEVPPSNTYTLHHPAGDRLKISTDDDPPAMTSYEWNIVDWESGVTEGGSSGSPLFTPAGRVIGHLRAGASTCGLPQNDFYVRLGSIWKRIGVFLDPLATGAMTTDVYDPNLNPPPTTFAVTSIQPTQVPPLIPGTGKTVQILGTGFTPSTTVDVDGAPLPAANWLRFSDQRIGIDMPQVDLGQHSFTVHEGGSSATGNVDVVIPPGPLHQAGNGDCGQLAGNSIFVFTGVDTLFSGQPGHTVACLWSLSNVPSVSPLATFGLGNQFTEIFGCTRVTIPAAGWITVHQNAGPAFSGLTVWSQAWCLSCGLPAQVSNLQETYVY